MKDVTKAPKPIFRTESPFTPTKASQLQQPQHDAVVQLLINTLSPIGEYRSNLPKPAKKRNKKRNRKDDQAKPEDEVPLEEIPVLQPPGIQGDVLVGFNAVTRHLEALSKLSNQMVGGEVASKEEAKPRHVVAVILLRPLDDIVYSHLPTLCHTASLAYPELPATRLVLLDPSVEKKVAAALGQSPNVSVLALLEAGDDEASGQALCNYIRQEVQVVEVPWLKQAMEAQWLGTKVDVQ